MNQEPSFRPKPSSIRATLRTVISTEAAHSLIVGRAVEKSAFSTWTRATPPA